VTATATATVESATLEPATVAAAVESATVDSAAVAGTVESAEARRTAPGERSRGASPIEAAERAPATARHVARRGERMPRPASERAAAA